MEKTSVQHGEVRYYRHGDEFWRDLIARWKTSGIGVRKFCEQNGVATSTFHKRRADLDKSESSTSMVTSVMTPDVCFIPVLQDSVVGSAAQATPPAVTSSTPTKSTPRDCVVINSGGMRIELTGAHADRVVRQVLGRLGGFAC